MLLAVSLRRFGAVVALLGISCLLVALVLPWAHFEPNRTRPGMEGALPDDYSALRLLTITVPYGHPAAATLFLYLLPLLGSCLLAVEARRAWQGRAATRSGIALLLLGIGCALWGLAASPLLVQVATMIYMDGPVMLVSAGPGVRVASLGFVVVVAGGVLLAVGAFLHRWMLRRNDRRASATTTG